MKSADMIVSVKRGETWAIDFEVFANDGITPFVVLSELENPYLKITVKSNKYERDGQYEKTWWLDLAKTYEIEPNGNLSVIPLPRFAQTEVIEVPLLDNQFDANTIINFFANMGQVTPPLTDVVWMGIQSNDDIIFAYTVDGITFEPYQFRIVKGFQHEDTAEWVEQSYLYDITIVTGTEVEEFIINTLLQYMQFNEMPIGTEDKLEAIKPFDRKEYYKLKKIWETGEPLMPGWKAKQIILEPTEIKVGGTL